MFGNLARRRRIEGDLEVEEHRYEAQQKYRKEPLSDRLAEIDDPVEDEDDPAVLKRRWKDQEHQRQLQTQQSANRENGVLKWIQNSRLTRFVIRHEKALTGVTLTGLAAWTRLRDIVSSTVVTWDEAHFGKFGAFYLKGQFYFDVHPPLAKMLVALSGYLAGFDGSFEFPSGQPYPDINYAFMRQFNASFGVLMVPLAYFTARAMGLSRMASTFAGTMVLLDNAYTVISRYILLDSMLLASTFFLVYCLANFRNTRHSAFSLQWWWWLSLTGVSIGLVSSVKWVGFFGTALVGLYTIDELWNLLGDVNLPKMDYLKHWVARAICLIAIPISIYVACFALHFAILTNSGTGDNYMSSSFQASLNGSTLRTSPLEVAYGSKVTVKNVGQSGGLLHSHVQSFPGGSRQQQVTCYHHRDVNNEWYIEKSRDAVESENAPKIEILKHGDIVRLVHTATGRNLHSHEVPAPVTTTQWEVSAYGMEHLGDDNDDWILEVVKEKSHHPKDGTIRSLSTHFRLRHSVLGCLLRAENVHLPQWGFGQVEVTCDQRNLTSSDFSTWNVEQHWNDKLPPGEPGQYKLRFWNDFWHLNHAMMTSNNALVPDPDKADQLASNPLQWPLLGIGMRLNAWGDNNPKYYLVGNVSVWWPSALSLVVFMVTLAIYSVRRTRNIKDMTDSEWDHFQYMGKVLFGGWFLHFMPFCAMGRVTYLHHYFPALYFSVLLFSFLMDHFLSRPFMSQHKRVRAGIWMAAFTAVVGTFIWFWPVTYGIYGPANDSMHNRQWRSSWDIVDDYTVRPMM